MLNDNDKQLIKPSVTILQIIVIALAVGVSAFTLYSYYNVYRQNHQDIADEKAQPSSLTNLVLGLTVVSFMMHLVVPRLLLTTSIKSSVAQIKAAHEKIDQEARAEFIVGLASAKSPATIVACALLEGTAFFSAYAYMATKELIPLIVAVAFIVLILVRFPTVGRVTNWIEKILRDNELEQQFS